MPLLDIKVSKKVQITCSLEESTAIQVDKYAAFLQKPAEGVVNGALEYVFAKDKDFQEYLDKNPNLTAPETLRAKCGEEDGSSVKPGRKTAGRPSVN